MKLKRLNTKEREVCQIEGCSKRVTHGTGDFKFHPDQINWSILKVCKKHIYQAVQALKQDPCGLSVSFYRVGNFFSIEHVSFRRDSKK